MVFEEAARNARRNDEYEKADELIAKALAHGDNASFFYQRGHIQYAQRKYEAAVSDFNRSIELYPESSDYHYWRSEAYGKLKKYKEALINIDRTEQSSF